MSKKSGIDPTANVLSLVLSANARQDDLRNAAKDKQRAHNDHIREMMELRADHAKEIRNLESDRLDKIRQVDVLAVSTAADRAQAAINALAAVTASNAENLRNALNATATSIAAQQANIINSINERISSLEKSSYTGLGRQAIADPQLSELVAEMKNLSRLSSSGQGRSKGIDSFIGYIIGVGGFLLALITLAVSFYFRR